jgi:hypothetical protein
MRLCGGVSAISRYANGLALYSAFERDPEKWAPVFQQDHAPANIFRGIEAI